MKKEKKEGGIWWWAKYCWHGPTPRPLCVSLCHTVELCRTGQGSLDFVKWKPQSPTQHRTYCTCFGLFSLQPQNKNSAVNASCSQDFLVQHSMACSVTRAGFGKSGGNQERSGLETAKSRNEKEMAEQKSRVEEDYWTSLLPVCVCVHGHFR